VPELRDKMLAVTNNKAVIDELQSDELAPTQTHRPKFLRPFDYMVSFYSVQRSDEIDPTWIFIFSFPIFYGLMVTDVGYGVASFILASLITRKTDPDGLMYNAAKIWQLNAIAAIFFGALSNQYFGFKLNYSTPFSFDWLKNTPELIAITVLFGVAQVILGLFFGIINSYHHGHKKLAVARFTSILVVACGTVAVAGAFFSAFDAVTTEITGGIAIVSLLLTVVLSGSEATEITNLITHPLSYARLMGFGLGSVIIAFLIDMAFTPNLNNGILIFLLYGVIFIALHFLNMLLSIFEGIVQGVRLNFVEFFSKFYIGNGVPFKPFSFKRVYTEENND
jgi:V/A-type H+/Na+-transporting ATPase subunit I